MPRNLDRRIESCTQEQPGEWFVELRIGYHLDGAHCFGEDARADIRRTMKRVQRCRCASCLETA